MDLSVGAITYHHQNIKATSHYERCVGNCQTILNPLLDVGVNNHHALIGANSIARFMAGYRYNFKINNFTNITTGGYYQDNNEYKKLGIDSNFIIGDIVPLAGVDLVYKKFGLIVTYPVTVMYYRF